MWSSFELGDSSQGKALFESLLLLRSPLLRTKLKACAAVRNKMHCESRLKRGLLKLPKFLHRPRRILCRVIGSRRESIKLLYARHPRVSHYYFRSKYTLLNECDLALAHTVRELRLDYLTQIWERGSRHQLKIDNWKRLAHNARDIFGAMAAATRRVVSLTL